MALAAITVNFAKWIKMGFLLPRDNDIENR